MGEDQVVDKYFSDKSDDGCGSYIYSKEDGIW